MDAQGALKIAGIASAGYSAQMIGVPEMANKLYFKEGHPENKNMSRWFGHALATCSAAQILASGDSQPSKARKAVLLASAGQYLTAPLTMLTQKEFKPEMVALNTVTCGVVGALCLKAALKE